MILRRFLATVFLASAATAKGCKPPSTFTTLTSHPTRTSTTTSSSTSSSTTETITSYPESCTFRPTQTYYSTSGCALTCASEFCIIDAVVTVPCGCPRVWVEAETVTVCATKTPCWNCHTGWGFLTVTETSCVTNTAAVQATATAA